MGKMQRRNNGENTGKITVQMVRSAHFRRLTHQKLTDFEKSITEKYDFEGDQIVPRVKYEAVPIEEIRKQIARGEPPQVLKRI